MITIDFLSLNARKALFLLAFSGLLLGCAGESTESATEETAVEEDEDYSNLFSDNLSNKQYGLPSPFQVAALIKKAGFTYAKELLNPLEKSSNYTSNYSKALNLGIYGTDLGYAAIFEQTQDAIDYMNTSKEIADNLGIMGAFEKGTIDRIENNLDNKDSLLHIVAETFSKSDEYLKENEQNKTSALILAGGWVEALYLACNMVEREPEAEVMNRIGEQKISLNILILLVKQFEDENDEMDDIGQLIIDLEQLKEIYQDVSIKYDFHPPTHDEAKRTTTVNTVSDVTITNEVLGRIKEKIESIRNTITA